MIKVKVAAIMELALVLKGHEHYISLPDGSRVSDLLEALASKYGQPFTRVLYGDKQGQHIQFYLLLNGRSIDLTDKLKTQLKDDDHLFFLPPAGGG